ncbi:MAG: IS1634 family transposase [Cyclobacteriaceae bacterium]|nr:IS1634 family transposase [Cyclobacteriaceae bacterium]
MFIREVKKQRSKDSKVFYQYTLAQAARVDGKVKQRAILYLGSDLLLGNKQNRVVVLGILKSKIFSQEDLFPSDPPKHLLALALSYYEKYCIKYGQDDRQAASIPPAPDKAEFHNIDIIGMQVNDVKTFGAEHLCSQVLDKLQLQECLASVGLTGEQTRKALIGIAARAIFSVSEHKTAEILQINSELSNCFNHQEPITHKQLYVVSDTLYKHKAQIDKFLYRRITDMFDLEDKLVIFDISNTYFESRKADSKIARHGRSKEKRDDCPLVVFTGVINAQGFIRHSRVYEGNTPDMATLADMIEDLRKNASPTARHTIVMDAGIATEENLALVQEKGYKYVCVSRKRLKDYPIGPSEAKTTQLTDREKNKVELAIFNPDGYADTWMYVQSEAKRAKEQSMNSKLKDRFEEDLNSIATAIGKKGGTKGIEKVWERIGRAKQKHNRVSSRYEIKVPEKDGTAISLQWSEKPDKGKDDKSNGVYFIRTNYNDPTETQLWDIYNTIREVESTFRCLKSELNIRPVHHQNDERIEAHIYLTILAYQLVNTIRHMLKKAGINHDWQNIVRIMSTQTIQTIELPTDKKVIHLRKPAKPIKEVQQIYDANGCAHTQSATKKYVVYH